MKVATFMNCNRTEGVARRSGCSAAATWPSSTPPTPPPSSPSAATCTPSWWPPTAALWSGGRRSWSGCAARNCLVPSCAYDVREKISTFLFPYLKAVPNLGFTFYFYFFLELFSSVQVDYIANLFVLQQPERPVLVSRGPASRDDEAGGRRSHYGSVPFMSSL